MTKLELLAPARNLETGFVAIDSGADAVYIGAPHHGARAAASNTVDDIRALCSYAHIFRARVYVTLNTLVYDNEIKDVERLVRELYDAGVDALIVQDMAFLQMDIPPISLHASTQCDIRTPEKARFLQNVGFDQLVLPRELTLNEIRSFRAATDVSLEAFVHGALCVCYSGDCRASLVNGGRSANRGECAQICRLPYTLSDGNGNVLRSDRHLLSLKDMNRMAYIAQMAEAGISSFKIEGRLKSVDYVRNVVAAYSSALNKFIGANPDKYSRLSFGRSEIAFRPDVSKAFNRGFTSYFLAGSQPEKGELASMLTPKHIGSDVAGVVNVSKRRLTVSPGATLSNGDGLGYFDKDGKFHGFRINRIEGNVIHLNSELNPIPEKGSRLYRNFDKSFADTLSRSSAKRTIAVNAVLDRFENGVVLTLNDQRGCRVSVPLECEVGIARSAQCEHRKRLLQKTGDTVYRIETVTDNLGDNIFIPNSQLAELRRMAISALDHAAGATYPLTLRVLSDKPSDAPFPKSELDMHDNVANSLASRFYAEHGAKVIRPALEVQKPSDYTKNSNRAGEIHVMTTRYCLRRELGLCLKNSEGKKVKGPLVLTSSDGHTYPMRLDFDCADCRMHVVALKKEP